MNKECQKAFIKYQVEMQGWWVAMEGILMLNWKIFSPPSELVIHPIAMPAQFLMELQSIPQDTLTQEILFLMPISIQKIMLTFKSLLILLWLDLTPQVLPFLWENSVAIIGKNHFFYRKIDPNKYILIRQDVLTIWTFYFRILALLWSHLHRQENDGTNWIH